MDLEGFAYKGALFPSMFLDGLWLPFYLSVCDVLDMVGVASAQLLPITWRILVGCCVIWRRALEEARDTWPSREFFLTHRVLKRRGNICGFDPIYPLIRLEQ